MSWVPQLARMVLLQLSWASWSLGCAAMQLA
jgi:hypothetical protein